MNIFHCTPVYNRIKLYQTVSQLNLRYRAMCVARRSVESAIESSASRYYADFFSFCVIMYLLVSKINSKATSSDCIILSNIPSWIDEGQFKVQSCLKHKGLIMIRLKCSGGKGHCSRDSNCRYGWFLRECFIKLKTWFHRTWVD